MSTSARLIRRGRQVGAREEATPPAPAPAPLAGVSPTTLERGTPAAMASGAPAQVARAAAAGPSPRRLAGFAPARQGSAAGPVPASVGAGAVAEPLAFALLALFLLVLYTRPQDLLPELRPFRLAFVLGLSAGLAHVVDALRRGVPIARPIPEVLLMGALLALAAASIPFSLWPGQSAKILLDQLAKVALAFLLVAHLADTARRVRTIQLVLVGAGVYLAAGAFYAYSSGALASYGGRAAGIVGGMFGDPNDLALTLVITTSLAAFQVVRTRSAALRGLLVLGIAAMLGGIFVTFSRGGLIALLVAAAVGILRLARHGRGLAAAALIGFAVLAAVLAPEGYGERAASIVQQDRDARGSIEARLTTLRYGVEILLENPVFGVGLGSFPIAEGAKHGGVGKWNEAHNAFLEVGAELGWGGLAVYLGLVLCAVANVRAAARLGAANRELVAAAHGLETATFGFLAGAMFLSQAYTWHFYILLGLTIACRRLAALHAEQAGDPPGAAAPKAGDGDDRARRPVRLRGPAAARIG